MKYCANCGNPMEDDMLFCQKCGTRFQDIVITKGANLDKLEKMKKYNLVLDSSTFTWEYLREDGKRAADICLKQDKLCVELCELVKDILANTDEEEKDLVEREVYTYILKMGYRMCREGEKLFANYSGYKELFDMGNQLVKAGKLNAGTFLGQMSQQDMPYKSTAGLQGLQASRIKGVLDEDVIFNNMEYRELTKELAIAFNDMWEKCGRRYHDFYLSPSIDFINTNRENYEVIIAGLPQAVIDSLDENIWNTIVDAADKNNKGSHFREEFINNRTKKREERLRKEQEAEDRKYWESHSREYEMMQERQTEINKLKQLISDKNSVIDEIMNQRRPYFEKKKEIDNSILEKGNQIKKLEKKIFGKAKAEESIQVLNGEIYLLEKESEDINNAIKQSDEPLSVKRGEISEMKEKISILEQEIKELRNM